MAYALLADVTVLVHLGFVGFVAVGGFLAWRHPALLRAHVPAVLWALGIVTVGWPCPLTITEKQLRVWAGGSAYPGAFLDRYVTGVLYPARYAPLAQALVAAALLVSYAGLWWRRQATAGAHDRRPRSKGWRRALLLPSRKSVAGRIGRAQVVRADRPG